MPRRTLSPRVAFDNAVQQLRNTANRAQLDRGSVDQAEREAGISADEARVRRRAIVTRTEEAASRLRYEAEGAVEAEPVVRDYARSFPVTSDARAVVRDLLSEHRPGTVLSRLKAQRRVAELRALREALLLDPTYHPDQAEEFAQAVDGVLIEVTNDGAERQALEDAERLRRGRQLPAWASMLAVSTAKADLAGMSKARRALWRQENMPEVEVPERRERTPGEALGDR